MKKIYKQIVERKITDHEKITEHVNELIKILEVLWLKCTTQSTFFESSLMNTSFNTHWVIQCSLSVRYYVIVNTSVMIIFKNLKKQQDKKHQAWILEECIDKESILNAMIWLLKIQWLQVLSTFSELKVLKDIKKLLLLSENDKFNEWICVKPDHLYALQLSSSLYEKYLHKICLNSNVIKMKVIDIFIDRYWEKKKKAVFCIFKLTITLIVYWVSHIVYAVVSTSIIMKTTDL